MVSEQGHARMMDFGLAFRLPLLESGTDLTKSLSTLATQEMSPGTLAYMSPEQLRGESLDQRSDLFSLGVILHEMLTGRHPFLKGPGIETASAILKEDPPPLADSVTELSEELSGIVGRLLAKTPGERYPSADRLVDDLREIERKRAIPDPVPSPGFLESLMLVTISIGIEIRSAKGGTMEAGAWNCSSKGTRFRVMRNRAMCGERSCNFPTAGRHWRSEP